MRLSAIVVLIAALASPMGALAQAVAKPAIDPAVTAPATATSVPAASHNVIGISEPQLSADYWIARQPDAENVVLNRAQIAEQNTRLQQIDPSLNDIEALPETLTQARVKTWIEKLSQAPTKTLFDERGVVVPKASLDALTANVALDAIAPSQPTRYGLVTRRADLRTFPTALRVFNARGNTDIDRFQESALFPGTPVAIVHSSADGQWWFVVSTLYAAWVDKQHIAQGSAAQVFGYGRKTPYLVVTGATAQTVFTPDEPGVSQVQLEMGVRVPLLADWPGDKPVNGQHPYIAHVIELPRRAEDGSLTFSPALLPKTADVAGDYLPLNRENVLRQGFKFLGERYGWGHSYNTRDCSGFVSEIYRSFGVQLPRNTGDQAVSPALNRVAFDKNDSHAERVAVLRTLQVGDLIYIPGHVMMVIGLEDGLPYVIHDTTGITYRDAAGALKRVALNGVSVTPLAPLLFNENEPTVDRITSIQRIRP